MPQFVRRFSHQKPARFPGYAEARRGKRKRRVVLQPFQCCKTTRHGAGNRTRTCTLLAVEPKSTESTNSTMPAYSVSLRVYTAGGPRRRGLGIRPQQHRRIPAALFYHGGRRLSIGMDQSFHLLMRLRIWAVSLALSLLVLPRRVLTRASRSSAAASSSP